MMVGRRPGAGSHVSVVDMGLTKGGNTHEG